MATITASRTVTAADVLRGFIENTVTCVGRLPQFDHLDNEFPESATATCDVFEPGITIVKTPNPTVTKVGHDIVYTYTITNTSTPETPNLILDSVIDDVVGDLTATAAANGCDPLATPGGSCTFTASSTVQAGDPDPLVNTVEAHYHPDGFANDVSASTSATVDLIKPSYTVLKTCSPDPVFIGQTISWDITLTNTALAGDVASLEVTCNDPEASIVNEVRTYMCRKTAPIRSPG
jgi:hypothetical protein